MSDTGTRPQSNEDGGDEFNPDDLTDEEIERKLLRMQRKREYADPENELPD